MFPISKPTFNYILENFYGQPLKMSRPVRPSAVKARENLRAASVSPLGSELSDSLESEGSSSSPEKEKSSGSKCMLIPIAFEYMSSNLVSSMDRYLDKNQDGVTVRRETPWISTIRGPAARLDSLRTVPKTSKLAPQRGKQPKRRGQTSESENESYGSSSDEESSFEESSSDDGEVHIPRKTVAKKHHASAPRVRASERIKELGPSKSSKFMDMSASGSSGSDSSSSGSGSSEDESLQSTPPRKNQGVPKVVKKVEKIDSEVDSSEPDYDEYMEDDGSASEAAETDRETDVEEASDLIVDKIIAKRRAPNDTTSTSGVDRWEYLVKWRCRAYIHCEWLPGSALMADVGSDKRSVKLKNFNSKHPPNAETVPLFDDGRFFNPIFESVERIIAVRHRRGQPVEFLVKWTGVPYGESTWEVELDLPTSQFETALAEFESVNDESRCSARMTTDSRKSAGRVLGKQFDPTVDFANCLEAAEWAGAGVKGEDQRDPNAGGAVPIEYKYIPRGRPLVPSGEPPFRIFDFQKEGISWLLYNWSQGRGCMLADEMGLGKTVQTAVTLAQMKSHSDLHGGGELTALIVAPLSTIEQWKREIKKWTDLEPVVYHGCRRDRNVIRKYEFNRVHSRASRKEGADEPVIEYPKSASFMPKFDVLIATFETVSNEPEFFADLVWSSIVIDEAHKLKSSEGKARTSVLAIPCRHRLLLTGTPIQNNVTELWNLLHLCSPSVWNDQEQFLAEFGTLKSADLTQRLQNKIQPFLLQRRKADVLSHLMPAKEETIVSVELTKLQKETYRAVYEKNLVFLTGAASGGAKKNAPSLVNVHMELRKCCNHPFLVQGVEDRVSREIGSQNDYNKLMESLIASSGKMVFLDKLLVKLEREQSKILIFSQFTMMLDLIEDYLRWRGYAFERLDGAVKGQQRQEAVDRFNKPTGDGETKRVNDSFVFLLSTKAGGVGLNLTAANYVLLFDHDWNPQNDLQAQARCHRIGQKREVMIFRLVTRGTYEEKMFQVASQKLGLEQAVMSGDSKGAGPKLSKEEMDRLLKEGAYAMMEDDENEKKFCAENVEEILQTRSKTVSTFVEKGSGIAATSTTGFSKARFQVNEEAGGDVDVNDPNFWAKMASLGVLAAAPAAAPETEYLDYSQRKGRATFKPGKKFYTDSVGSSGINPSAGSSVDSEDFSGSSDEETRGRAKGRGGVAPRVKTEEIRCRRMKQIVRYLLEFGVELNQGEFDRKFYKFNQPGFDSLPVAGFADQLLLVVALYLQAKDGGAAKYDEIFFCPTVRACMGMLAQFTATGESPPPSQDPFLLDSMFPDFSNPVNRLEMSIPSFIPQPPPRFVTDAIPKNRNPKKLILEIDQFNEIRFLIRNPGLLKRAPGDRTVPADWSVEEDVRLLTLVLEHGREEVNAVASSEFGSRVQSSDFPKWASMRADRLVPKLTLVRSCQLTFVLAAFGLHHLLLEKALRASGFPWNRKFVCGDSCLDLIGSEIPSLLTRVPPLEHPIPLAVDDLAFNRFIINQLPPDTPLVTTDVADYAKALLYRVMTNLGRKSDRHDAAVKLVCKPTRTNEFLFTGEFTRSTPSVVYPQRGLTRIDAFKLMWRFQTLHFLRNGSLASVLADPTVQASPVASTFIPSVLSLGLDRWESITNLNRQVTPAECLHTVMRFVCRNLIEIDAANAVSSASTAPVQAVKKRTSPPNEEAESAPATKSMKLTDWFAPKVEDGEVKSGQEAGPTKSEDADVTSMDDDDAVEVVELEKSE